MSLGDYRRAILLALSLGQPGRLLSMFQKVITSTPESEEENASPGLNLLDQIVERLDGSDLVKLLTFVRDWNTQAKTSSIAQTILFSVLKLRSAESIIQAFKDSAVVKRIEDSDVDPTSTLVAPSGEKALSEMVEALIPYSERHMARMDRLLQESYVVDYILGEMDNGMFDAEYIDTDDDGGMEVDS